LAFRLSTVGSGLAVIVFVGMSVSVNVGINVSSGRFGVDVSAGEILVRVLFATVVGEAVSVENVHAPVRRINKTYTVPFFTPSFYYCLSCHDFTFVDNQRYILNFYLAVT
jgi:hypothetical protein